MRKLYQTDWHSIPFSTFSTLRSDQLPDEHFYRKFYQCFFKKYQSPSDLEKEWVRFKIGTINQLINRIPVKKLDRILSLSCGLGLMEMELIDQGYTGIEVTEISPEPLQWVKKRLSAAHIHMGSFPGSIPPERKFDWILISGVDYLYDEEALPPLLSSAGNLLTQFGSCTLVCFPLTGEPSVQDQLKYQIRNRFPQFERLGLIKPAQFWGYSRTLNEFRTAIAQAGLHLIQESPIDTQTRWPSYQLTFKKGT